MLNSQVDLIHFQSHPGGQFEFMVVYQDNLPNQLCSSKTFRVGIDRGIDELMK